MIEIVHREIRVRESSKEEVIPTDRKNRLTGVHACDTHVHVETLRFSRLDIKNCT